MRQSAGAAPGFITEQEAKDDASSGKVEALRKITCAIRKRFGRKVRIIVRADSGFAREEIMAWCEDNGVYYCLGLARNKRLSARLGKCFGELHRGIQSGEIQVRSTLKLKPVDRYYAKASLFMSFLQPTSTDNHGLALRGFGPDSNQKWAFRDSTCSNQRGKQHPV